MNDQTDQTPDAEPQDGAADGTPTPPPSGMLPGGSGEPQGPEDAAGFGAKRGDYVDDHAQHGTMVIPDPTNGPGERRTISVDQNALSAQRGDEPGKGGLQPAPEDRADIPTVD